MNEAEIRMQTQLFALIAEMYACNAEIEGMKAENQQRAHRGLAVAYAEDAFAWQVERLQELAALMRQSI